MTINATGLSVKRLFPYLNGPQLIRKALVLPRFLFLTLAVSVVAQDAEKLELRGTSAYYWLFLKLYDARLYLPPAAKADDIFTPIPKRLELTYARRIPLKKIIEAGDVLFLKNTPSAVAERLEPSVRQINAAYREPSKGDRYTLEYRPGHGTDLRFNDALLTTIAGDEFAHYYFRIWLGEHPVDKSFRNELLAVNDD